MTDKKTTPGPSTSYAVMLPKSTGDSGSLRVRFADAYVPTGRPFVEYRLKDETVAEYSEGCSIRVWLAEHDGTSLAVNFTKNGSTWEWNEAFTVEIRPLDFVKSRIMSRTKKETVEYLPPLLKV